MFGAGIVGKVNPLAIRWRYHRPWLPGCSSSCASTRETVEAQARALSPLVSQSVVDSRSLVKEAGAEGLVHRLGHLFTCHSEATFQKDLAATRRMHGGDEA